MSDQRITVHMMDDETITLHLDELGIVRLTHHNPEPYNQQHEHRIYLTIPETRDLIGALTRMVAASDE